MLNFEASAVTRVPGRVTTFAETGSDIHPASTVTAASAARVRIFRMAVSCGDDAPAYGARRTRLVMVTQRAIRFCAILTNSSMQRVVAELQGQTCRGGP
jgi:hypothetical protein